MMNQSATTIDENVMTDSGQLSEQEVKTIQLTWRKVEDSVEMTIDFYNRLFYLYPALRPLFKEDIRLQARKFTAHLSYLIKNIHDWNMIQTDLKELGQRHESYEVLPQHYDFVREALFYALRSHLAAEWNENTEQTWAKFYQHVAHSMMNFHHHH